MRATFHQASARRKTPEGFPPGRLLPKDLWKLIKNGWDSELQPRRAELARAFGIDRSTL